MKTCVMFVALWPFCFSIPSAAKAKEAFAVEDNEVLLAQGIKLVSSLNETLTHKEWQRQAKREGRIFLLIFFRPFIHPSCVNGKAKKKWKFYIQN